MARFPFTISLVKDGRVHHKRIQMHSFTEVVDGDIVQKRTYSVALSGAQAAATFNTLEELVADNRLGLGIPCETGEVATPYTM